MFHTAKGLSVEFMDRVVKGSKDFLSISNQKTWYQRHLVYAIELGDKWVLALNPRPITVGFNNLFGVANAPVSKKLTVKSKKVHLVSKELSLL